MSRVFTEKQIDFMRSIGLSFDFNNLSDDEYVEIEEQVGDWLQLHGIAPSGDDVNEIGLMCESVLDALP